MAAAVADPILKLRVKAGHSPKPTLAEPVLLVTLEKILKTEDKHVGNEFYKIVLLQGSRNSHSYIRSPRFLS
jgi:hypothetical protein